MSTNEINQKLKLIEASKKIALIYARYGQTQAAEKELTALGRTLQGKSATRGGL